MNTNIKILIFYIQSRSPEKKNQIVQMSIFISVDGLEITVVYLFLKFFISLLSKTSLILYRLHLIIENKFNLAKNVNFSFTQDSLHQATMILMILIPVEIVHVLIHLINQFVHQLLYNFQQYHLYLID